MTAKSIHIGLNHVDPACYNGWDGALAGCINDANDMRAIADSLGYESTLLTDSEATADRVIAEIGQVADHLQSGDILFLSYSGHGGQVEDVNGDEDDVLDETWVLWDRQLIDDELYALWGRFPAGVRIVVLSDSCHSGTVARMMATLQQLSRDLKSTRTMPSAAQLETLNSLSRALGVNGQDAVTPGKAYRTTLPKKRTNGSYGVPRRIPADIQTLVNTTRSTRHAAAQWLAGPSEKAVVDASLILISGCQDDQLSMDGARNGLFTEKLKQVWDNGNFSGGYRDFWTSIKSLMPERQQPNYFTVGISNATFEGQSPFATEGESPAPQPGPTPPPAPSGSRPTLREGSKGPDVQYLQRRLIEIGHNLTVDGDFGPRTASAVRSFQSSCGLQADGVVGPVTWEALG